MPAMDARAAHTIPLPNLKHRTFSFRGNVKYCGTTNKVTLFYTSKMREIKYQLKKFSLVYFLLMTLQTCRSNDEIHVLKV